MIRFRRRSWRGALQSAWCAVYRRRTCCRALAASAGRNCWAIRSVLVEPTIGYCTCRVRRPKTISHDDAIAASCASLRHSGRGREADVLMYPAALSARPFSIDKLFVPSCILAIVKSLQRDLQVVRHWQCVFLEAWMAGLHRKETVLRPCLFKTESLITTQRLFVRVLCGTKVSQLSRIVLKFGTYRSTGNFPVKT